MACDGTKLFLWVSMASSSSFSLVALRSLLVPCILFFLCSVTPHKRELSPFTGFHKKSTLSILWLWWRFTLWSTTFHHPDGVLPPLFLSVTSKNCSLGFTPLRSSAIWDFQGITFQPIYSSRVISWDKYSSFPKTNLVSISSLVINECHLWLGCLTLCSQCLGHNRCLPVGWEMEGSRKGEREKGRKRRKEEEIRPKLVRDAGHDSASQLRDLSVR